MAVDRGFPQRVRPRRVAFNLAPTPVCLDCTSDSSSGEETSSESAATDSGTESESEMDTSHAASQGAPVETPGGEMRYGPAMEPRVRAAIESARLAPPRHASSRRLEAASVDELHARPYQCIPPRSRARTTSARVAGQPHHSAPDATASAAYARRPTGAISLRQLFKSADTYRAVIQWIADATAAMADLAAGKRARGPPTLVVTQDELEEWARGIIWDTRDPDNCVPYPPSDETTEMPGPQINREIFRAWAAELNITDEEIVAQVGYGGVEAQALVSLDMVLTFHHKGLVEEFAAAKAVIDSDIALGFVGPAYLHPTSVPCKLGPRNVAMQERSRPLPSGGVEFYLKPRVTFNLSYGIDHDAADMPTNPTRHNRYRIPPVNGCVPDEAAEITLPPIHHLGSNAAVVGAHASDEPSVDGEAASVDITNAYSWLLQQRLDRWLQCFIWEGGVRESLRVVFGGKFAPQSFTAVMAIPHD